MPHAEPGQIIDQYRLIKPLGQGADSEVFLAVDTQTQRKVSLKILMDPNEKSATARFERAALLWERLNHPNVAAFMGYGLTEDGFHYLVLEYIQGTSMEDVIDSDAPMEIERALRLFRQLLLALRVSHRQGILHRDIKPTNILITHTLPSDPRHAAREQVKLIDFGLARTYRDDDGRKGANLSVTQAGHVVGTPRYMAPEQVTPDGASVQSDLYAAALVFYEMLTGRYAVEGDMIEEVIYQHLRPGPTIDANDARLPKRLGAVLARATERRVDDRYESAEALMSAIDRAMSAVEDTMEANQPIMGIPSSTGPVLRGPNNTAPGTPQIITSPNPALPRNPTLDEPRMTNPEMPVASAPITAPTLPVQSRQTATGPMLPVASGPQPTLASSHPDIGAGLPVDFGPGQNPPQGIHAALPIPETGGGMPIVGTANTHTADADHGQRKASSSGASGSGLGGKLLRTFITLLAAYAVAVGAFYLFQDLIFFRPHILDKAASRQLVSKMGWEPVTIKTRTNNKLTGYFGPRRQGAAQGSLLYLHGMDAIPEVEAAALDAVRDQGLHVLVFGRQGYGDSEGTTDSETFFEDALVAYDHLLGSIGAKPFKIYVHGRGVGGSAAAVVVAQQRPVEGLILENASPDFSQRLGRLMPIVPFGALTYNDFGVSGIDELKIPILFLHGKESFVAPASDIKPLYDRYNGSKLIREVQGAGHHDLPEVMGDQYARSIAGFVSAFGSLR